MLKKHGLSKYTLIFYFTFGWVGGGGNRQLAADIQYFVTVQKAKEYKL